MRALSDDALGGRGVGTSGNARARELIEGALERAGVQPVGESYRMPFAVADALEGVNLVGVVPGRSLPDRYLLLSAHHDHLGIRDGEIFNGADDNASGVAVVLEIARRAAEEPLEHSLLVVFFDAEERGLAGSRSFVANPPVELEALALAVNLDMVARGEDTGLFASGTFHHPALRPVLERAAVSGPVELRFGHDRPEDGGDNWTLQSDHAAFHLAGIPFVYFGVEDHPDYHQPTDDWHRIDPEFFSASAITIERAVRALDEALAAGLEPRSSATTEPGARPADRPR
ncbi:MAG TPA: M28 family peptidase [Thermoanaerobaculia bacterium]|nr:M28 family peptidase [Thermoanaerobaculia bacterium]